MNGGPSQLDTWDYKPELQRREGMELQGFDPNTGFFTGQVGPLMASPFQFRPRGECGKPVSALFPKLAEHVDDMAFLHSCWTDSNNHSPALFMMNTGMTRMGFPCAGSWATYGLGSESQDLPAFVVMSDPLGRGLPKGYSQNWGSGFLPSVYQGTWLKPTGEPIDNLKPPAKQGLPRQRAMLDFLSQINEQHFSEHLEERELAARIDSFELAYRMQSAAPEALNLSLETAETQDLYGLGNPQCAHFGKQCLTARRLVERGTRFVQIYSGGMENERSWDGHKDYQGESWRVRSGNRYTHRRLINRPETPRSSRRNSCHLGRRIWTSAHLPEGQHGPRPQPPCVHRVDGRRWCERRHISWGDR